MGYHYLYTTFLPNKLHHFYLNLHRFVSERVFPSIDILVRFLSSQVHPFWFHLLYFLVVPLIGFSALKLTNTRSSASSSPNSFDIFFTSVSATTVSSMTAVEMEVFSNTQLVIMTILMSCGGEVFVSMLSLQLRKLSKRATQKLESKNPIHQLELGNNNNAETENTPTSPNSIKYRSMETLARVMLGYLIVVHFLGSSLISIYIALSESASSILKNKGLNLHTFSIFIAVSTFANCGYTPTNEGMIVFRKNPGLLLIVLPQILLGNTLFPCFLRLALWSLGKLRKREEYSYILDNYEKLGFSHLLSAFNTCMLAVTALGFVGLQFVFFSVMEWNSEGLEGLSVYEKLVGSLFQASNSRHSGESIVDLSTVSAATIVLFVVMMYLPPYTLLVPTWRNQEKGSIIDNGVEMKKENLKKRSRALEYMNRILSPLSTLFIFTLLICITERKSMKEDPLNFNVLNIVVEVMSSYGNVGYTMGYSCKRRLKAEEIAACKDSWVGFSGRWSNQGKFVLIIVMLYGRLKKFNLHGAHAWLLL